MRRTFFFCAALAFATHLAQGQELPPAPDRAPAAACDDWIVSVRHCPEKRSGCESCDFAVSRLDSCGRDLPSSVPELLAGLQPGAPVCFVLHGSFVSWEQVCAESRQAQGWLRQACPGHPLNIVFFTWASDQTKKVLLPVDIMVLGRRADRHGFDIAQLIGQIPDEHPICLIGHSHGARMAAATLQLLAGGGIQGVGCPVGTYQQHRIRVVLAAAAFDHTWFKPGECFDRAVYRAEGILNLQNRHDAALAFYPLHRPSAGRALARTGLTSRDRHTLGAWSAKLIDLDVTERVGHRHVWTAYLDQPSIAQQIAPYVFFNDAP